MSGRIIPTILGEGQGFPGIGLLCTFWSFMVVVMYELLSKENYPIIFSADLSIFIYMMSLRMLLNVSNKSIKHGINYFCLCSYTNTKSKILHVK